MLSKQTSARSRNCAALSTTEEKKWVRWGPSRVWCAATFSTFTHTCSMTTDCSVLFCCIFSITDSLQIQSQQTSSPADSHACYTVRLSPETLQTHSPFVFCCLFLPPCFVLSCVFGPSFSFSPSGGASPATVISHLFPVGRGQVGEKNTGTNQGCESGDEGHRLGFICVTSLSFTRSYNPPSIPSPTWCRITPRKTISSSLLPLPSSPTMITGFTAEKGRNTQTSVTSFSSPVRAGVLLWDA